MTDLTANPATVAASSQNVQYQQMQLLNQMTQMINNANIVAADLNAWNGVVHVIDAVLLPPASVEGLQTLNVSAFPNPCTNNITVQSSDNNNELFQVVNAAGQIVAQGKLNGKQTVVNTSAFASGVYTIFVQNGARVNFIKE